MLMTIMMSVMMMLMINAHFLWDSERFIHMTTQQSYLIWIETQHLCQIISKMNRQRHSTWIHLPFLRKYLSDSQTYQDKHWHTVDFVFGFCVAQKQHGCRCSVFVCCINAMPYFFTYSIFLLLAWFLLLLYWACMHLIMKGWSGRANKYGT